MSSYQYDIADFIGSAVRGQLTSPTGDITYARAYDPYGVVTSTAGAAQTSYGYTGEFTSNEMVYLRARYYTPGMGRFLTRDTWGGNFSSPMSYNKWNYVSSNPINYTDPTGYSPDCAIKGTCGPNVTNWFMGEMSIHYQYGLNIRLKIARMKAMARTMFITYDPCATDIYSLLKAVAIEPPFDQIVREFDFPTTNVPIGSTPLITPVFADKVIDTLGVLEYALYGLAIDYSNVRYTTLDSKCYTGTCTVASKGETKHDIVSLCVQCRDASDLGNMMFGLGGAARGYSWPFVVGSALLFNKLSGDSTPGWVDGWGAYPGWVIGNGQSFRSQNTSSFCAAANLPMGHDNVGQIQGCQACSGVPTNTYINASSIVRRSGLGGPNGEATTIDELENKLNMKIDEIFNYLVDR